MKEEDVYGLSLDLFKTENSIFLSLSTALGGSNGRASTSRADDHGLVARSYPQKIIQIASSFGIQY